MTTAPYAKLRAAINGGAPSTGVLVGAAGQTCQLSQDPAGLGQSFKYELRDFPEGFPCPANWSTDAGGVYFYLGVTPPVFTLPALPLWGKITPVLTVNNGDPGTSGLPATQFVDGSTVISTPDPSGSGYEDIAYGESNQWDTRRKWMGSIKRNLRRSIRLGPYTSAINRRAQVCSAFDIGREAFQTDTSPPTLWKVLSVSAGVGTWTRIDTGAEAVGSALFGIMGAEPSWWIDGIASTIVDAGGGIASSATDASGHGFDATFTATHQPSIIASGLSGHRTLRFSSSQYGGNSSFTAAAPGTTSQYFFMVVKSTSLAASSIFLGTSAGGNLYVGAANKVNDFNAGAGPISDVMTAGTWYILEALRTNQGTDYVQLNGTGGTVGASAGNNAQTAYMLNATTAGGQINDCEYATAFEYTLATPPTPTQRANMRAWARSVWPAIP